MKFNIHFFIMLVITTVVFCADILIYCFSLNYWLAVALATAIAAIIIIIFRKKIKITTDFEWLDLIFFGIFILKFIALFLKVECEWDTKNYHIYLQETPFIDKINFDFFAGRIINSFLYPLGDRIHYLGRSILGYRRGVLFSYLAQIAVYYQSKKIIKTVNKKESKLIPILATVSCLITIMYNFIGSYYIDIFSCVFILEIIVMAFQEENFLKNKTALYLSFLYTGIATGIKVPNLILIFIVYIFILIKNIKNLKDIKLIDIPICLILFILPFGIYAFDNFMQTGSVMFPYYNNIFKSKYFADFSWQDPNFGIPNVLWAFIWPLAIIENPLRTYDVIIYDLCWPIGYLITINFLIYALINKEKIKENKTYQMACLAFIMTLIWAIFLMAYARYAEFLPILYFAVFSNFVLNIKDVSKNSFHKCVLYIFSIIIMVGMSYSTINAICEVTDFIQGCVSAFKKYGIIDDRENEKVHIDGAWVVVADNSYLSALLREEGTPIYNFDNKFLTTENMLERREKLLNENLYIAINSLDCENIYEKLNENNLQVVELVGENLKFSFLGVLDTIDIYKIEYNSNLEEVQKANLKIKE